jgi:hypothetical protein
LRATPRSRASFLLALGLIAAAAGCGGKAAGDDSDAEPVGEKVGGSVAALAQCRDWNAGTEAEKQATIADIRSSLTPQSQEESGTSLSDEHAYRVFQHWCSQDFAQGFKLYKVYARAAAFAPLEER